MLVASFDATVLRTTGIKLIEELWSNNISAELAVDAASLEELMVKYKDSNHRCIVIAKQDSIERGFKIRNLVRKEEFDVRPAELVAWLRSEVQTRHHREGTADPRLARQSSQQEAAAFHERANDVRILVPQHRSKKTNRRNIVESGMCFELIRMLHAFQSKKLIICDLALVSSREVADNARNGPVAAIDTRDDVLEAIRGTRLSDAESWRTVIQNAPLTERKYLGQVHELLSDLAAENRANDSTGSYTNAFIYNYRTGSCVYYDLGP